MSSQLFAKDSGGAKPCAKARSKVQPGPIWLLTRATYLARTLMLLQRGILHSTMQILQVLTLTGGQVAQRRQAVIAHNVEDWQLGLDFLDQPVANLDRHERPRSRATKRAQYSSPSTAFAGCCLAWDFSTRASQSFLLLIKLTWRFPRPVDRNSRRMA